MSGLLFSVTIDRDWTEFFTHVQETRYYVPSMLMIAVSIATSAFGDKNGFWVRSGRVALVASIVCAVSYAAYRAVKVHALDTPTKYERKFAALGATIRYLHYVRAR